jgi:ubiquinone/menaquinone biosynthesis C-methylase UbiE
VIPADINSGLPFEDNSFQTVFCSHVIEHVDSPLNLLRESNRVLKNGGALILAVPVEKTIVRLVKEDYFKDHETHLYGLSVECLDSLIRHAGMQRIRVFYQFPFLSRIPQFRKRLQNIAYGFCQYFSTMYWVVVSSK